MNPIDAERVLSAILVNSPAVITLQDVQGRYVSANRQLELLLGIDGSAILGKTDSDLFPAATAQVLQSHREQVLACGQRMAFDEVMPDVTGAPRWFYTRRFPVFRGDGTAEWLVTIATDKTEERRISLELMRQSEALENSLNGFDIVDGNGRFVYVNPAYLRMWGYERKEDVLGTSPVGHCADPRIPLKIIETLRRTGECEIEFEGLRKDGTTFDVRMWARLAHDAEGREIYPTTSIDVTEERRAQRNAKTANDSLQKLAEDLQSAVRARDEFLSVASHELRTPLTSLLLQAQQLSRMGRRSDATTYPREKVDALAAQTEKQVRRLGRLVDDMLDVSRIQSGKLQLEMETFDLGDLAREVLERMEPQFESAGYVPPTLVVTGQLALRGDRYRIEQVLNNLLTNAIRYGEKRPVAVHAREIDGSAELCVADHGLGIAPDAIEAIFDRFARAANAGPISGLGLGLFITRQIVAAHGGNICVESELGAGSTFRARFPLKGAEV